MSENRNENLIQETKKVISVERDKRKNAGGNYNIFSILGIERDEVFTHSNMIYSFLDPQSGHFMGNKYLNLFVKHVLGITEPIDISSAWRAVREWPFTDGRIDFVVFNDN